MEMHEFFQGPQIGYSQIHKNVSIAFIAIVLQFPSLFSPSDVENAI